VLSVGAALYFRMIWRWRVAHFDRHNDGSTSYHEAAYAARLRAGHAWVTQVHLAGPTNLVQARLARVMCAALGSGWEEQPTAVAMTGRCFIVFFGGILGSVELR
jgi:hypothetical protein